MVDIRKKKVLEFVDIPFDLDLDKMRKMYKKYLDSFKEFREETGSKMEISSKHSEWIMKKVTGGDYVGMGHSPIDILLREKKIGIDCSCLCMNSTESNEKSIIQNFKDCGKYLDILFKNREDDSIVKMFKGQLYKKLNESKKMYKLKEQYYGVLLSTRKNVYLIFFKLNIEAIKNLTSGGFTRQGKSVNINNFIEENEGRVKIYKPKKRMEIRFRRNILKKSVKIY